MVRAKDQFADGKRLVVLDVLRGIAILGVMFLHVPWMGNLSWGITDPKLIGWSGLDPLVYAILAVPFEGSFRGLLELMFGAGAALMLWRTRDASGPVGDADIFLRRCLLLIAFGAVHATVLLQVGDILLTYGVVGFAVYALRNLSPRLMLIVGAVVLAANALPRINDYRDNLALQQRVEAMGPMHDASRLTQAEQDDLKAWQALNAHDPERDKEIAKERAAITGDYAANLRFALEFWRERFKALETAHQLTPYGEALGTMLIGMALFRLGFFAGHWPLLGYAAVLVVGYVVGLTLRGLELSRFYAADFHPAVVFGLNPFSTSYDLARIAITLGHASLVMLMVRSAWTAEWLRYFAAPGRMALSIYVGQTLICMWLLFPGFGLGLWGQFSWTGLFVIAVLINLVMAAAAHVWLRYFAMGPLEWALRTGSRLTRTPLRLSRRTGTESRS